MKAFKIFVSALALAGLMGMGLTSCKEDKLGPTIFPDEEDVLDPNSYTYKLDKFLKENYLKVYNLDFRYKMQDVGTDMDYNLVPATYENSIDMAVLTKHLWFDVYKDIVNPDFLKQYGPRIIHLIGSPAYNANSGSMVLGLAEGGLKVSLFRVNAMNINDFDQMNEYYFKTMHHEFCHILHQTKSYPVEFNTISTGHYDGSNWQDRQEGVVASLGFVTTYASSAYREDFAEVMANFIVKTDAQWNRILELAARGWESPSSADDPNAYYYCYYYYKDNVAGDENKAYAQENQVATVEEDGVTHYYLGSQRDKNGNRIVVYPVEDKDGIDGVAAINQKVEIMRNWLKNEWGVDLDALRAEVQKRQVSYDIDALRKWVTEIE